MLCVWDWIIANGDKNIKRYSIENNIDIDKNTKKYIADLENELQSKKIALEDLESIVPGLLTLIKSLSQRIEHIEISNTNSNNTNKLYSFF